MKWLGIEFSLVMVVLLSPGRLKGPYKKSLRACDRHDILFSYLDMDQIYSSYPYADHKSIINAALDIMNYQTGAEDPFSPLHIFRLSVCYAEGTEEEVLAWKNFVSEIHHMMHIDQSMFDISKILLGDEMALRIIDPPTSFALETELHGENCALRLLSLFKKYCGRVIDYTLQHYRTLFTICKFGVEENEFVDATFQVCGNYMYDLKLPLPKL